MDRLAAMYAFRAVVDCGGFAAAARTSGRSKTALSKAVADLETHLGVRLLQRTTRRLALTDAGRQYHARCASLLADLEESESEARDNQSAVQGRIRLVAPQTFGELYLIPLLARFMEETPAISLDLHLTDHFVDLIEEQFDLAVRIADLPESSLVARPLCRMQLLVCAAPDYLARHGRPLHPQELTEHTCVIDTNLREPRVWTFQHGETSLRVPVRGSVAVNSASAVRAMALAGRGIALCPDFAVAPALQDGRLERLLERYATASRGIYAVYPNRQHLARRLRVLIDFLVDELAGGVLGDAVAHPGKSG